MRAFIVDDEPKVCQLIRNIVDWDKLGIKLVGEALNGVEALSRINETGANIIITDIKMPGMDGIQLISKLKEKDETIRFIVISGYSEFEYAQNALRLGVADYILKPINKKELEDTLKRIKEQRQETDSSNQFHRLRKTYIEKILEGSTTKDSTEKVNLEYSYKFSNEYFQGFIIKLDLLKPLESAIVNSIAQQIEVSLGKNFENISRDLEVFGKDYFFYGINGFPKENLGKVQMAYRNVYEQLSGYLKELEIPVVITIGIGEEKKEIGMLEKSIKTARNGVEQKLIYGAGNIYFGLEKNHRINIEEVLVIWNRHCEYALERLDFARLFTMLEEIKKEVMSIELEGWEIYQLVKGIGERYINLLRGKGVLSNRLAEIQSKFVNQLYNTSSFKDLWQLLNDMLENINLEIINDSNNEVSQQIRKAQKYIYNNYNNNITLEEVSEYIELNSSYLSTLFKKEMGMGFLEYLTHIRIEESKILLTNTNDTIASIASQVGYSDVKHFNRLFKRSTVLKPNEYRKLHS